MAEKLRIKKGDEVIVLTGRDRGKIGAVTRVFLKKNQVIVQGVSGAKRYTAPSASSPGGIVDKEMAVDISNVALLDPKDRKQNKVGYRFLGDGRKVRYAKRSGEVIDQ